MIRRTIAITLHTVLPLVLCPIVSCLTQKQDREDFLTLFRGHFKSEGPVKVHPAARGHAHAQAEAYAWGGGHGAGAARRRRGVRLG